MSASARKMAQASCELRDLWKEQRALRQKQRRIEAKAGSNFQLYLSTEDTWPGSMFEMRIGAL